MISFKTHLAMNILSKLFKKVTAALFWMNVTITGRSLTFLEDILCLSCGEGKLSALAKRRLWFNNFKLDNHKPTFPNYS